MTISEDFAKLVDLGSDLLEGKKTLEGLVDEAAERAGLAPKEPDSATASPAPAKVLTLVSRNPATCKPEPEQETKPVA